MMFKYGFLFLLQNMILFNRPCNISQEQSIPVAGYGLVWRDEFDGKILDRTKWKYRALGQRGDAINTESAIYLDGRGNLIIEARRVDNKVYAGIIDTEGLFETQYGYFECRAKLPMIPGIWPAFWLQSSSNRDDSEPATAGAEIDIFEYFHHERRDTVSHSLHWGGYGRTHKVAGPVLGPMKRTADGYHVFGLEWTPASYSTFVDGVKTYTGFTLISGVPEFIVLSLEVNKQVAGPLDSKKLPGKFMVDYVRVYKKISDKKPAGK